MDKQKIIPIVLIVGLVAVAATVVILTARRSETPNTTVPASNTTQQTTQPTQPQTPTNVGPDTVVPDGTSLDAYVNQYYQAVKNKDYETAYKMQAASKKAGSDVTAFKQQIEGYGIESFEIGKAAEQGESATVEAKLTTGSYGVFTTAWKFSKKDGKWIVDGTQTLIK